MDDEAQSGARNSPARAPAKAPSAREQKLAAALRANLRRRKAPAMTSAKAPPGDPDA